MSRQRGGGCRALEEINSSAPCRWVMLKLRVDVGSEEAECDMEKLFPKEITNLLTSLYKKKNKKDEYK